MQVVDSVQRALLIRVTFTALLGFGSRDARSGVYLPQMAVEEALDALGKTNRSGGGFGSTGITD